MPSVLQRLATRLGYVPNAQVQQQVQQAVGRTLVQAAAQQRSLLAALTTHDVASWQADGFHVNVDTEAGLATARARSRDAARNNPWARRFVGMVLNNVLGPHGARYQSRVRAGTGNLRAGPNDALEAAYTAWSMPGACDVTHRYSRRDFERLALRHVVVDGEVFIRFVPGRGPHRFQVQLIPADAVPITARADLGDGVRVRQGVEVDAMGRVLAYHMRTDDTTADAVSTSRGLKRVPAGEVLHLFLSDEANQLRGVPWMATALKPMYQAADFAAAGLNKARESAKRGGFFTTDPDAPGATGAELEDGKDSTGQRFQTLQDGTWDQLPAGVTAQPFESDYPNIEYGQFIKDALRNVASALDVSYITLGNDLEAVNYSSGQLGLEGERTLWLGLQQWFVQHLCTPVHRRWLDYALVAAPQLARLSFDQAEVYADGARWQMHRWQPLDPLKTIEAQRARIEARLTSPQREIAANGDDPDEILAELAEWQTKTAGLAPAVDEADPAAQAAAAARRLQLIVNQ